MFEVVLFLAGIVIGGVSLLLWQFVADIDRIPDTPQGARAQYDQGWADGYQVANDQHREKRRKAGEKAHRTRMDRAVPSPVPPITSDAP